MIFYNFKNDTENNFNKDLTNLFNSYKTTSTDRKFEKKDTVTNILDNIQSIFPWAKKETPKEYTMLNVTPLMLNLEWNKAATRLNEIINSYEHPSYDFKIFDIPVKMHGNYIQVGSRLIPTFANSDFFKRVPKKERIEIFSISMYINSININLAA